MTADKQEVSLRNKATKKTAVVAVKANENRALDAKSANGPKARISPLNQESGIDKNERRQMIAEAAYYRFQNRGCEEGCDIDDWLIAEQEIDRLLDF